MKGIFVPPPTFFLPLLALLIVVVWVCYSIVLKNLNSKDLVFSFTALAAAFAMFYLNICLTLKGEVKEHTIKTHMIVGKGCVMDIFSINERKSGFVIFNREELSQACMQELAILQRNGELAIPQGHEYGKGISDAAKFFLVNSVLGHLLESYPDWQMKPIKFKGSSQVSFNSKREGAGENSYYTRQELDEIVGNPRKGFLLGKAHIFSDGLTLPPGTRVSMEEDALVFDNEFVRIEFGFSIGGEMSLAYPDITGDGRILLRIGHEWSVLNFDANIKMIIVRKRERAGSVEYETYSDWINRIVKTLDSGLS